VLLAVFDMSPALVVNLIGVGLKACALHGLSRGEIKRQNHRQAFGIERISCAMTSASPALLLSISSASLSQVAASLR
jgi:hypothetical protein